MSDTSPRQVLYALVALGFMMVVVVLTIAGAAADLVPTWWSATLTFTIAAGGTWMGKNWRSTVPVLLMAIGVFVMWLVGTVVLAA